MKIKTKLYLYDSSQEENSYRGTDYSKYVLQGDSYKEDISEELDTAEITLCGLSQREEFAPETKFILEKYSVKEITLEEEVFTEETLINSFNIVVDQDTVEQPILSDNNYFNHHISFLEPSVVAQKRLVDNISITYKLKDVNLNTVTTFDINQETETKKVNSNYTPQMNFGNYSSGFLGYYSNRVWGKYFAFDGNVQMLSRTDVDTGSTKLYQNISDYDDNGVSYARFKIPKLKIFFGVQNSKNFSYIGDASLHYVIQEYSLSNYLEPTKTWEGDIISNSNLAAGGISTYPLRINESSATYLRSEYLIEKWDFSSGSNPNSRVYIRKYTDILASNPDYLTKEIVIQKDKRYTISISLKEFENSYSETYSGGALAGNVQYIYSTKDIPTKYAIYTTGALGGGDQYYTNLSQNQLTSSSEFQTYATDTVKVLLQSANPYNALSLLQKAIINSHFIEKEQDVFVGDINNMNVPFYIDENYIEELLRTQIVEMFYNQKNLWEVLLEIGKYIHAIPRIEFGENDKYKITFDKLGETDQKENKAYKMSIMNFKGVSDYVSACSSYITNMVQLGGEIDEWVAPKTINEQALVYNDTCSIVATKPIIELLKVEVRCASGNYSFANVGQVADMTNYIYESNIYKLLSVSFTDIPNKGVSLYYELGKNNIIGCDYRNPTENSGDPQDDYAIKKIIFCAFFGGYPNDFATNNRWNNIKVNDFVFHLIYRTKDSVRQNQTRPDLRKYLLNSKFDRVPQHNQFNNQTDVVVDSIKFGNNIYGKLIRTGNSNYKIVEWVETLDKLKHKGELYRIEGDLYYVARVKHTYYTTHIISEVEYSKDYNQLSQVIGIPSEPRFYEISERSLINREIAISDYLLVSDDETKISDDNTMLKRIDHLSQLIFGGESSDFAKYVVTTFKGDKNISPADIVQGSNNFYVDVISPLNAYSSENTLTYEWDMMDNLSAGDKVDLSGYTGDVNVADNAYKSLKAVQYTDIFGKAPLMDFYLLENLPELSSAQVQQMPVSPFRTRVVGQAGVDDDKPFIGSQELEPLILATNVKNLQDTDYNGRGIGILKDCREVLSINYNEELLTNSDTFVVSPYLFSPKKKKVKFVLLNKEVNKLSSGFIDISNIITPFDINGTQMETEYFDVQKVVDDVYPTFYIPLSQIFQNVNPNHFGDENGEDVDGFERVKSIAVVYDVIDEDGDTGEYFAYSLKFILAKNIPNLENYWGKDNALKTWFFGSPNKETLFNKKQ